MELIFCFIFIITKLIISMAITEFHAKIAVVVMPTDEIPFSDMVKIEYANDDPKRLRRYEKKLP